MDMQVTNIGCEHRLRIKRRRIYQRDEGHCRICGLSQKPDEFLLGHLVDASRGGTAASYNLMVSCRFCEALKPFHETEEEFHRWNALPFWEKVRFWANMEKISEPVPPEVEMVTFRTRQALANWARGFANPAEELAHLWVGMTWWGRMVYTRPALVGCPEQEGRRAAREWRILLGQQVRVATVLDNRQFRGNAPPEVQEKFRGLFETLEAREALFREIYPLGESYDAG